MRVVHLLPLRCGHVPLSPTAAARSNGPSIMPVCAGPIDWLYSGHHDYSVHSTLVNRIRSYVGISRGDPYVLSFLWPIICYNRHVFFDSFPLFYVVRKLARDLRECWFHRVVPDSSRQTDTRSVYRSYSRTGQMF